MTETKDAIHATLHDKAEYSFPYVAGWSSDKEVPELKASLIKCQIDEID